MTETGAIVVLEAMAAGKIVIANNIYPINMYIKNGVNGFLFNDADEAVQIVEKIILGEIDIENISREARSYAKKHHYEDVCRRLEEVYKRSI